MLVAIADLQCHLAISPDGAFITSDNPAFKYNQYCEDIDYQGITGALCRGFQIFLPLAPRLCLLLYDRAVYNVPRAERSKRRSIASQTDLAITAEAAGVTGGEFSRPSKTHFVSSLERTPGTDST